jgi:hypothetical protein
MPGVLPVDVGVIIGADVAAAIGVGIEVGSAAAVAVSAAPSSARWMSGRYCAAVGVSVLPTLQVKPPGAIAERR